MARKAHGAAFVFAPRRPSDFRLFPPLIPLPRRVAALLSN